VPVGAIAFKRGYFSHCEHIISGRLIAPLGLIGFTGAGACFSNVRQKKLFFWPIKLEADLVFKGTGQGLSPGSYAAEIAFRIACHLM